MNDLDRLKYLAGIELNESSFPKSKYEFSKEQLKDSIDSLKEKTHTMPRDGSLYKDTMKQIEEYEKILKNKNESIKESAPADQEKFVKDAKKDFKKRYGKRWKQVLYATAWKKHDEEVKEGEELTLADTIFESLKEKDRLFSLAGIELTEADDVDDIEDCEEESEEDSKDKEEKDLKESKEEEIAKVQYAHPPANKFELKAVDVNDDYLEVNKELTGMEKNAETKVKVPKSVTKSVDKRIKELNDTMEQFGGGGSVETARDELLKFKELLASENLEDYQRAQVLYGTLWTEIQERLPTAMVSFLHTGKELETTPVQ